MILDKGIVIAFDEDGEETEDIEMCNMKQGNSAKVMEIICQFLSKLFLQKFKFLLKNWLSEILTCI